MTKFSYFLGSEQWQPEDLIKHAEIARESGFDMLTISEHFHPWVDDYSASNFTWTTLGALANKLPELDLGTGVTTPLWRIHPGVIAQAAATVDRLSPSTFHLGVGTGENINEGPLGYDFPKYEERKNRLIEALTIIRRLLDGEKLDFNVIDPAKQKSKELKKENLSIHTYRWTMFADNDDDAWTALRSWRGLRAPSRLQQLDPEALRVEADSFPKEEIMGKFSKASTIDDLVDIYSPLVNEFDSDIVTIQISSINQEETIKLLGKELLPKLRN